MKSFNKIKNYLVGLVAITSLIIATSSQATTLNTNVLAGTNSIIVATNTLAPLQIIQIQVVNSLANTSPFVILYDSPGGTNSNGALTNTYAIGSFTNAVISNIVYSNIYTNILGQLSTNGPYTNVMYTVVTNIISQYTNQYSVIWQGVVTSNTTLTYTPPINTFAWQGIVETNSNFTTASGGVSYTITYNPSR